MFGYPKELAKNKNARFKVVVTLEELGKQATESEIEAAAIKDVSEDFLSEEELNYYLNLKEL